MQDLLTIDATAVYGHFQALNAFGIPKKKLEEILELSESALVSKDTRVSCLNNIKMIEKGITEIGPEVPIKLGGLISIERLGICGHILQNCTRLSEAANQFFRYQNLLYAVSAFTMSYQQKTVVFEHSIRFPIYQTHNRILVELAFSAVVTALTQLMGKNPEFKEFWFTSGKPQHLKYYNESFTGLLKFGQKADAIVMDSDQFNQIIPESRPYINDLLMPHADALMARRNHLFSDHVEQIVMENLHEGTVNIEMVSEKLNMSRWTLNRKLKKEGLSFKSCLNTIRKKTAFHYLDKQDVSMTEIAFLLGYSELSSFSRAFKKWTGENPSVLLQKPEGLL